MKNLLLLFCLLFASHTYAGPDDAPAVIYEAGALDPMQAQPAFRGERPELQQGDILLLSLRHLPEGVRPEAKSALGPAVFVQVDGAEWQAVVPVGNTCKPGRYAVNVRAGDIYIRTVVVVRAYKFDRQNLRINLKSPAIRQARSAEASRQFRERFLPVYSVVDAKRYWQGPFAVPTTGRISTTFGSIRITNGDPSTERTHKGMDYAAPAGTPVYAPNAGRVVFAENLMLTGNTIVIEHGGGLKSIYYHMNSIDVTVDRIVERGARLGTVGSTGYSTGPHLHYEMRIGEQAVRPTQLY
jgi:murein DD-endopeptidase MepM/ murein hydrolase activator NlpD